MRRTDSTPPRKRARATGGSDGMRSEYDFSKGVRGATARRFAEGTNIIVLDADLTGHFPDSASVNRALRLLVEIAGRPVPKPRRRADKAGRESSRAQR